MELSQQALPSSFGLFYLLPREIRDRIFTYASHFSTFFPVAPNAPSCQDNTPISPGIGLLIASRCIYTEAKICLYRANKFCIIIHHDISNRLNRSIMGRAGFRVDFALHEIWLNRKGKALFSIPRDMLPHCRELCLFVGVGCPVKECDIVPTHGQSILGPEAPKFAPLLKVMEEACELLAKHHRIHQLRIRIESSEESPGSMKLVFGPILPLRDIARTFIYVYGCEGDDFETWELGPRYTAYLGKVLALAKGTPTPAYDRSMIDPGFDEDSALEDADGIFKLYETIIGPVEDGIFAGEYFEDLADGEISMDEIYEHDYFYDDEGYDEEGYDEEDYDEDY